MRLKVTGKNVSIPLGTEGKCSAKGAEKRIKEIDSIMKSLSEERDSLRKAVFYSKTKFTEGQLVHHSTYGVGIINYSRTDLSDWWKLTPYKKDGTLSGRSFYVYNESEISPASEKDIPKPREV
jgi:hypothetical protein